MLSAITGYRGDLFPDVKSRSAARGESRGAASGSARADRPRGDRITLSDQALAMASATSGHGGLARLIYAPLLSLSLEDGGKVRVEQGREVGGNATAVRVVISRSDGTQEIINIDGQFSASQPGGTADLLNGPEYGDATDLAAFFNQSANGSVNLTAGADGGNVMASAMKARIRALVEASSGLAVQQALTGVQVQRTMAPEEDAVATELAMAATLLEASGQAGGEALTAITLSPAIRGLNLRI